MLRGISLALGGLIILAGAGEARSQIYYPSGVGYGGYGFGGWSETPQGSIAQGFGAYARGAGVYNYDTAAAAAINENNVIQYNQYLYNSMMEARRRYNRRNAQRLKMDDAAYDARQARIRQNPTDEDISSGDALNAILDQMSDPKVMNGSALRLANASVSPEAIKAIPFRDETDAVTISLETLTSEKSWPLPLRAEAFQAERESYRNAMEAALNEDVEGTLKPETIAKVRNAVSALYKKAGEVIPKTRQPEYGQAMNYLKGLAGMARMLERPNVEAVLAELEKVQTTSVGNLLAFMHTYNLRFAPAETPKQKAIYNDLLPLLVASRDKVVGKPEPADPNAPQAPPTEPADPTGLFHGIDPTHLNPTPTPADPATDLPAANPNPQPAPTAPVPQPAPAPVDPNPQPAPADPNPQPAPADAAPQPAPSNPAPQSS